jgi:hypothetical protein
MSSTEGETIMFYIKQIMALFGCDFETAVKVQENMVLDFSEASKEEFEREAHFIYNHKIKSLERRVG